MSRSFSAHRAVRERVPMIVGLVGPSGSGKTYSALRLATGMKRVTKGEIYVIDTEARRSLHYSDDFDFKHVPMAAPFSPLDYLAAIEFCKSDGADIIIIDSMTHEHSGEGGVLDLHDTELDRLAGDDQRKRARLTMLAWAKPKAQRRKLIDAILRMGVNAILCFRAKEKIKLVKGQDPVALGWMPVAGDDYVYEATINCLLYPACGGVPNWNPDESGERMILKRPAHLKSVFQDGKPLSEATGEGLAKWAQGDVDLERGDLEMVLKSLKACTNRGGLDNCMHAASGFAWDDKEKATLRDTVKGCREAIASGSE